MDHEPALPGHGRPSPQSAESNRPLRMLQLGGTVPDARRTEAILREAGLAVRAQRTEDLTRFRHQLVQIPPDLVLIDDAVLGLDVQAAVRMVREHYAELPVIVISDGMDDEAATELIKAGASAYLRREHRGAVASAVRGALAEAAQIRQHREAEARNAALARTDPLTGLPNRTAFLAALRANVAARQRQPAQFAVFYLDFDGFSDVNDSLGHPAGDALLCAAAERLGVCLRGTDILARLGGDEFAILQSGVHDAADCGDLAARLQAVLAPPFDLIVARRAITASIGIALSTGAAERPEEMMAQADIALYRAKETGRNRYCFYARDIDSAVRERQILSEELRAATGTTQFELRFAPQVASDTRRIVAVEAIAIWHNPRRGMLAPEQYFPLAERSGAIASITEWLLEDTCRHIAQWRAAGLTPVPVVVKLCRSPHQASGCLSSRLPEILEKWGVAPELLVLSFAEEAFVDVSRTHADALTAIAASGVGFAVDMFGEGHLPLAMLRDYPVSRIKIDRKTLGSSAAAARDLVLVTAVAALAAALGIELVVGGVSSEAEAAALMLAGKPALQGAAFGDAVLPGDIAAALITEPHSNG